MSVLSFGWPKHEGSDCWDSRPNFDGYFIKFMLNKKRCLAFFTEEWIADKFRFSDNCRRTLTPEEGDELRKMVAEAINKNKSTSDTLDDIPVFRIF